jgi:hypothetical protein
VVVVMMGNKNDAHISDINARLHKPARDAIASINEIMRSIDGQEVRRLRASRAWDRTGCCAECDEAGADLEGSRLHLREASIT